MVLMIPFVRPITFQRYLVFWRAKNVPIKNKIPQLGPKRFLQPVYTKHLLIACLFSLMASQSFPS